MKQTITAKFDGLPFKVQLEWGQQVACDTTCPTCGRVLEQRAVQGQEAMLMWISKNQGCTTPVMRFGSAEEMAKFLTKACAKIEKRKP